MERVDDTVLEQFVVVLWMMWSERNNQLFNRKKAEEWEVVGRALSYWEEYASYHKREEQVKETEAVTWKRPPTGWVKANVDAAVIEGQGTGLGMVLRDENGGFLRAAVRRERRCWPPEIAEMKAVEFGLKQLEMGGFRRAVVEMDCLQVESALHRADHSRLETGHVIKELQAEAQRVGEIQWSFVKQAGNSLAHNMAHSLYNWETQEVLDSRPPIFLLDSLTKEMASY
ncbi:unnamed protein product [Linum trigynum]|uniref:RNase H type-1 domain-containing protein n=1 Tax=Linum trigynum TaxID=586398 RepID=A0AAV2GN02_9ROSI